MITQLTDRCIAVEVPAATKGYHIWSRDKQELGYEYITKNIIEKESGDGVKYIKLPLGNWSILGRPNELKEEEAKLIVEAHSATIYGGHGPDRFDGYKDYCNTSEYPLLLPISSFKSLLKSKNVNPSDVIILINEL